MKALIAIPTYNGGRIWEIAAANIRKYAGSEIYVQVIDSGSIDNTVTVAKENGFAVKCINADEFNHGGTRNLIVNMHRDEFDIVIFLTQDAIPQPDFLSNILKCFEDPMVGCAYGR
ncbi:glycosyltransferase family 2 protein, partial [Escherichia coli]|nr:glycosyltransferase [Escherichia coli]